MHCLLDPNVWFCHKETSRALPTYAKENSCNGGVNYIYHNTHTHSTQRDISPPGLLRTNECEYGCWAVSAELHHFTTQLLLDSFPYLCLSTQRGVGWLNYTCLFVGFLYRNRCLSRNNGRFLECFFLFGEMMRALLGLLAWCESNPRTHAADIWWYSYKY